MRTLTEIERTVVACRKCPELRSYCAGIAREKKREHRDREYWGKPVPGWGDPRARVLLVGLAPGAHGSNRTGRPFTGDASGVWLYRALHKAGFANQSESVERGDALRLRDVYITAAIRCAPPQNKPTPEQRRRCLPFLNDEIAALRPPVIVTLGKIADDTVHALLRADHAYLTPRAAFAHGAESRLLAPDGRSVTILASYHPSRQNTNTGKLTEAMLDAIFSRCGDLLPQLQVAPPPRRQLPG
ncbi:MAG: uracil-DNA glycosylase [Candidatus Eremiobacteraeota bacterium]|nr:uracil-DNA glycosylase [Candidatus Eremiobacteraeota bacterium]